MDEKLAEAAFAEALAGHAPEFGKFFLARFFGLEISYREESCVVSVPIKDFMFNPQGSLHGGVIAFILDISMGHLLNHTVGAGVTLEMKTQYLKAARAGRVRAEGRFLKKGRSICSLETRLTDESGDLLAFATSTWQLLRTDKAGSPPGKA